MTKNRDFRIISGAFKGKRLKFPSDVKTHPMGNREKLALFNMVSTNGMRVLDIFAGSGALGLEALSRGAKEVVFVEKSPQVAKVIRENLAEIGEKAAIFIETASHFATRSEFRSYFDLILADPPYDSLMKNQRPSASSVSVTNTSVPESAILTPGFAEIAHLGRLLGPSGILAVSSPASMSPFSLDGLEVLKTHTYAGARLTIYTLAIDNN